MRMKMRMRMRCGRIGQNEMALLFKKVIKKERFSFYYSVCVCLCV